MPGVITPMIVKRPMMPKMKAPSRMRIGHGGSCARVVERRKGSSCDDDDPAAAGSAPPSSSATIALHAALDAAVEVVALELRRHLVADDPARHRVGQRALRARSRPRCASCGPSAPRRRARRCPCLSGRASTRRTRASRIPRCFRCRSSAPSARRPGWSSSARAALSACRQALARRRREDLGVVDDAPRQEGHLGREGLRRERPRRTSMADKRARRSRSGVLDRLVGERAWRPPHARCLCRHSKLRDRPKSREHRTRRARRRAAAPVIRAITASHSATVTRAATPCPAGSRRAARAG